MFKDNILYEDDHLIVINKPAYFPVQSARVSKSDCISEIKKYLKEKGSEKEAYVGLIHRLDEPVEGVLVFAKNAKTAAGLSKQLQEGGFCKEYTAAVIPHDRDVAEGGILTDNIIWDRKSNVSKVADKDTKGAKQGRLKYSPVKEITGPKGERMVLLDIKLYTGRHHQIRLQMSNAGMPVAGDRKYGGGREDLPLCLAATCLSFDHPVKKERMVCRIEPQFMGELRKAGFDI